MTSLVSLDDRQAEMISGGLFDVYNYSNKQKAIANAPNSNNFTNNYLSLNGEFLVAIGSTL